MPARRQVLMERAIVIFAAICAVTLLPARAGTVFSIGPATIPASPGDGVSLHLCQRLVRPDQCRSPRVALQLFPYAERPHC
ncbi:exported hypothetical protein [Candidatus Sulfopaludibacter sp. SbA3]|nr:exported hypothetical protein [Candidatus Sulfopaludibacter sp. SbA3]